MHSTHSNCNICIPVVVALDVPQSEKKPVFEVSDKVRLNFEILYCKWSLDTYQKGNNNDADVQAGLRLCCLHTSKTEQKFVQMLLFTCSKMAANANMW